MDSISESRLLLVYPRLADKIRQMSELLSEVGIVIRVTQGLRSYEEQDELYDQGRTAPGKIVTNVRGGESYHNYGLAVDCVPSLNGVNQEYSPDWNSSHDCWKKMVATGVGLGLTSGACWKSLPDAPHFQLTGKFPVAEPNLALLHLLNVGSYAAVFAAVDESYSQANG